MTVHPDFVIDDHEEPVTVFGGEVILPASAPLDGDTEMLRIYDAIRSLSSG